MLFSSLTFLYYFLPATLALYFIVPARGSLAPRNLALLAASVVFYAWGEPVYVLLMAGQALAGWFYGLLIERFRGRPALSRAALLASLATGLGGLLFFKYSDFFLSNLATALGTRLPTLGLALPIGISFYTFQILSYTIDLYRGDTRVQRDPLKFSAYVMLFPQLIAGPIVRYADVAESLAARSTTLRGFAEGARRFTQGLAKKVLLANVLGELAGICGGGDENSALMAWLYALAYTLHIYFDFSGYSDMAIGLGRIFGFNFPENFNYPYISRSATEFWRRWHMSLSSWFRDYVYIPLGGNRVRPARQALNISVVWLLTGFWHGAGWNFICWGLYFAALLLVEKFWLGGLLARAPGIIAHAYLLLLVAVGWVIFDAAALEPALGVIGRMFGLGASGLAGAESLYYLRSYMTPLAVGVLGATPLPKALAARAAACRQGKGALAVLEPAAVLVMLVCVTAFLADGSFNPFIYFRF
ncbi:MAG: MBOAT family protein [Clostridiales Family XIII bacterium]|jgi:alginate O-acetyltransferase complex protein AlgI|nr:MBOAT family protein [Clostridiales Family XIII bacterium]